MKTIFTYIITICILSTINAQSKINVEDFTFLNKTNWKGTLMYIDYSSGKETTLETTMNISIDKNKITYNVQYTYEPEANNKSVVKIKKNGTYFGKEKVMKKTILKDGTLKMTTFYKGKDNNRKANIYKTYLIHKDHFSISKLVKYQDSDESIIRNKQTYSRI